VTELANSKHTIKVSDLAPEFTATFRQLRLINAPDPSKTKASKLMNKKSKTLMTKSRPFIKIASSTFSESTRPNSASSDDTEITTSSRHESQTEELKAAFLGDIKDALGPLFNLDKWKGIDVRLEYLYNISLAP
jgi:hypothetical protein